MSADLAGWLLACIADDECLAVVHADRPGFREEWRR